MCVLSGFQRVGNLQKRSALTGIWAGNLRLPLKACTIIMSDNVDGPRSDPLFTYSQV